jgi:hypothetical protein
MSVSVGNDEQVRVLNAAIDGAAEAYGAGLGQGLPPSAVEGLVGSMLMASGWCRSADVASRLARLGRERWERDHPAIPTPGA